MADPIIAPIPKETPKELAERKRKYELHVGLIQQVDAVTKTASILRAYIEGPGGLDKRLGK